MKNKYGTITVDGVVKTFATRTVFRAYRKQLVNAGTPFHYSINALFDGIPRNDAVSTGWFDGKFYNRITNL